MPMPYAKEINHLNAADWFVLGTTTCPWCVKVKDLLHKNRQKYHYINLDALPEADKNKMRVTFMYLTKKTSIPLVFYRGSFIGGFKETQRFLSD